MKRLFFAFILFVGCASNASAATEGQSDPWKTEPPSRSWRNSAHLLGEDLFLELPLSKAGAAVRGPLSRESTIRLSKETLAYYVGKHFRCPPKLRPYLVRAPFGHGGSGKFSVYVSDGEVIVDHESLGKKSVVNRSALVVCLAGVPKQIFGIVGIDE